jgi:RNA polymerase sigma-70 factor (ECF subfamily)
MEPTDESLLESYRRGRVDALAELLERHRRPLYGYILRMITAQEDADDVFQEVWLRAVRHLDRYRPGNFRGWLFRIGHNLVVDRRRMRRDMSSLDEVAGESTLTLAELVADGTRSPAQRAADRDLAGRIAQAVAALPPEQKEVFLLRTDADMPFREIARVQGVSINTALARMQYALTKLRRALQDDYPVTGVTP